MELLSVQEVLNTVSGHKRGLAIIGDHTLYRSRIIIMPLFSYIANLIIASVQISRRGGLLIENVCKSKVCEL